MSARTVPLLACWLLGVAFWMSPGAELLNPRRAEADVTQQTVGQMHVMTVGGGVINGAQHEFFMTSLATLEDGSVFQPAYVDPSLPVDTGVGVLLVPYGVTMTGSTAISFPYVQYVTGTDVPPTAVSTTLLFTPGPTLIAGNGFAGIEPDTGKWVFSAPAASTPIQVDDLIVFSYPGLATVPLIPRGYFAWPGGHRRR